MTSSASNNDVPLTSSASNNDVPLTSSASNNDVSLTSSASNNDVSLTSSASNNDETESDEENLEKKIIKTRMNSKRIKEMVSNNQGTNALKMSSKHDKKRNKRTIDFAVGDFVSVLIPRIDRGGTDFPRLPGIIRRVTNGKDSLYEVVTKFGILNDKYRSCDLETFSGILDIETTTITNKITMREAARKAAKRATDLKDAATTCNCTGDCSRGQCSCFRKNQKCGSHCHLRVKQNFCCNK